MPTYFLSSSASDITGDYVLTTLQNQATSLVVSPAANNGTTTLDFVTPRAYPNRSGFTVSNGLVVLAHSVTNMSITLTVQALRVNSEGVLQTSGTISASQTSASTNTFSGLVDASWAASTCSDRIILRVVYTNTAMTANSLTLTLDDPTTYFYSSVPFDGTAACRNTYRKRGWVLELK